ncbi:sulfate ABC transporter substrate-binding protein [Synechococcus sp. CS-1328]|uniref:sulfate ABC transporter substrate-binding protein n=1 Tax=Synechococcus sp. CS-1328 TaxID=2847976 RepID=UPI00223AB553|nr:sulfate ABC transporter substrate-binding protein [Synechococcus sp. CS-1328]
MPAPVRRHQLLLTGLAALPLAAAAAAALHAPLAQAQQPPKAQTLTLVSYAVTKNAYDQIFRLFAADWKKKTGQTVSFKGSYGGSGSQTRAVIDGLNADIVNLAMAEDISRIEQAGLIKKGWESRLPNSATPIHSTVVALVRPGNPKQINSWKDLAKPNVDVVTANPKTSGGARWNFVALWGSVTQARGSEAQARQYIRDVYKNVDVLPKDAREATDFFIKRKQGDVLLNWETEAILAKRKGEWTAGYKTFSPNVLTAQPVAVVDKNVDRNGSRKVAEAFTKFLYTQAAQKVFVDNGFRPATAEGKTYARGKFPVVKDYTINAFGGWSAVTSKFFSAGAIWDQIFRASR